MHTNSPPAKRHRWIVVLPVVLTLVALTVREAITHQTSLNADVTAVPADGEISVPANNAARTVLLPNGVLRVEPGTRIDMSDSSEPLLRQGSVLIVTNALQKAEANGTVFEGWNGAFQLIATGSGTSVAALSTPVYAVNGTARMIVPDAMQWQDAGGLAPFSTGMDAWLQARDVQPLPDSYLRSELQTADDLSTDIRGIPLHISDASPSLAGVLQLPAARDRSASADRTARLNAVIADLSAGSTASLKSLLSESDVQSLLSSTEGKSALPLLLTLSSMRGTEDLLLPFIANSEELYLLALYHPAVRDHAWILQAPSALDDDAQLTRFVFIPQADDLPQALSSIASDRWLRGFLAFLSGRKDAADIVSHILPILYDQVLRFDAETYPERAARYRTAAQELAAPYADALSAQGRAALAALQSSPSSPVTDQTSSLSGVSAAISSSSASSVSIPALESLTHAALVAQNFMFTPRSTLHGHADGTVDIANVVLGTDAGDLAVSFTYDPGKDLVGNVEKNGAMLPYAISLKQYVAWLKSGR